jgi:hypothetical protein
MSLKATIPWHAKGGERSLKVPDGKEAYVEAIGSAVLHLHSGFRLHLINVRYVPSLKRNLILVCLLDIDDFGCNFGDLKFLIKYNNDNVNHFSKNETSSKL